MLYRLWVQCHVCIKMWSGGGIVQLLSCPPLILVTQVWIPVGTWLGSRNAWMRSEEITSCKSHIVSASLTNWYIINKKIKVLYLSPGPCTNIQQVAISQYKVVSSSASVHKHTLNPYNKTLTLNTQSHTLNPYNKTLTLNTLSHTFNPYNKTLTHTSHVLAGINY